MVHSQQRLRHQERDKMSNTYSHEINARSFTSVRRTVWCLDARTLLHLHVLAY